MRAWRFSQRCARPVRHPSRAWSGGADGPIHIHVAEQMAEVDECQRVTGLRPVQWLLQRCRLDQRWQLVHATHVTNEEIDGVTKSGAGA